MTEESVTDVEHVFVPKMEQQHYGRTRTPHGRQLTHGRCIANVLFGLRERGWVASSPASTYVDALRRLFKRVTLDDRFNVLFFQFFKMVLQMLLDI